MKDTTIGVDIAKSVFQVAVSHTPGRVDAERRLSRDRFLECLAKQPPATVLLEACGSATIGLGRSSRSALVARAPHSDETTHDEALALPLPKQPGAKAPPDMRVEVVERAHRSFGCSLAPKRFSHPSRYRT